MSNPTMLELAERVERLTGPDRELDVQICIAALGYVEKPNAPKGWRSFENNGWHVDFREGGPDWSAGDPWNAHFGIPPFTASLDAAMTLVPEGWGRIEFGRYEGGCDGYWAQITPLDHPRIVESERCATPALALTAACLRARASMGDR
jgi:hypothetical protein